MNKHFLGGLLLAIASIFLHSCSLMHLLPGKRKHAAAAIPAPDSTAAVVVLHHAVLPEPDTISNMPDTAGMARKLYDQAAPLFARHTLFSTFSCKARISFDGPDGSKEFNANIRVRKDSAIWVAISAMGLQVARAYVTTDSLFILVPLERTVTKIALANVARVLPTQVDFSILQHLIIGEPLRGGDITSVAELGSSWLLAVADSSYLQRLTYNKGDSVLTSDQLNTHDPNGPQAILNFRDYQVMSGRKVSANRNADIRNGNDKYTLDMEIHDAEFDVPVDMPFTIPQSYKVKNP